MIDFVQALVDGVMLGATYALLGLGFTLIFGVLRRLNLAFGPTMLLGVSLGSLLNHVRPGAFLLVAAATVAGTLLAGAYVERCAFRALAGQPPLSSMIASFALSMQLQELVALWVPSRTMAYPASAWLPSVAVGPLLFRDDALLMWGGATLITVTLLAVLYRTPFGLTLRAVAQSPETAALMGVNVGRVGGLAFLLAGTVGGMAGVLVAASQQQVTPYFGLWATVKGLTAMLVGGAGSIPGAVVGGLVLGVVEVQVLWQLGGQFRDLAAYALLLLVVAIGPARRLGDTA